jgi:hypothetical protein
VRFTKRWAYPQNVQHETGSDSYVCGANDADDVGAQYSEAGHSVPVGTVATAFYGVNPARNNGADIEPIPITPVRSQNWPGMQIQLRQGWELTNYGRIMSYDTYLRLLTDSATKGRNFLIPSPSSLGNSQVAGGPAPGNVDQMIQQSAGSQPSTPGGPGFLASGVNLSGRNFYG